MEHVIEKEIKLSKLNAKTVGERKRLKASNEYLVPCEIEESKDELRVQYNLENLLPLSELSKELKIDQIKLLINISKLAELSNDYMIDISAQNIYYDFNYLPKMLDRDVCIEDTFTDEENFISQYKSLIGHVLQHKYKFEDYYNGGLDLLKRNKETKDISKLEHLDEIVRFLMIEYKNEEALVKEKSTIIRKEKVKLHRMVEITALILTITLSIFGGYLYFISMPFNHKIIEADKFYLHKEYKKVIQELETIKIDQLPLETKYILASSYQDTNKLLTEEKDKTKKKKSKSKKKSTEEKLTITSKEDALNYWIQLGRNNYKAAVNTAKKLQDDDYLLNAYTNQYLFVAKDLSMDGEKKQAKLDEIDASLKDLKMKMEEKAESKKK